MTKKQVVWLIIKLIGVYFAYSALVAVPDVISSIYSYVSLPSPPRFAKSDNPAANGQPVSPNFPVNPGLSNPAASKVDTETPAEKAKNDALKLLLWNLLTTIFYGLVGWYLIRDGRFLYALLSREEPFDESGKPVEADSFPLAKKKENVVTSLNLSGGKEEITSLNLSDATSPQPTPPIVPPAAPENLINDAPKEEIAAPNIPVAAVEQTEQTSAAPTETKENMLLEIPDDESINEQKY